MLSRIWNWIWELALRSAKLRRWVVRSWYEFVAKIDHQGEVRFMNYGYADPDNNTHINLPPTEEPNRYQIQLYHRVASQVELRERQVLEVGSGRGGGAAYISANLHPRLLTGIDISSSAINFCHKYYRLANLHFSHGDAENLNFPDESFDAVVNIESSSHYGNLQRFLSEVRRVLRVHGHLLFADIREDHEIPPLLNHFKVAGLTLHHQEDIASGVVKALEFDEARKVDLIKRKAPQILHGALKEFAGTKGSDKYEAFRSGRYKYLVCVLRKAN